MSFVYFNFLFVNTIKRKPIWITWLLFLFTCTSFIIILPAAAKMNTLEVWANTTMAICQTFMGMVASLFTAVLAINIFKDTNEEGTELIIISKPISRIKIVLTKFLLFGFFCLLVNLSTVLLSVFTIFLPRTEPQFYWGLIVSMFIGNAVTFMVFGSISILVSAKFAKVGVIIVNIVISLVFLIYQSLTLFVFQTPLKILDEHSMAPSTYIVQDRNMTNGEYTEDEVVKFVPSSVAAEKHPCQATNWKEMKEFWEKDILSHDVTPILNATDFAGQLALTYLSVGTDAFAQRQANRMFAISRFYNYELTSPASPEIYTGVENKKSLNWVYVDFTEIPITLQEGTIYYYLPSAFGFAGIPPLSSTRLRGYTDLIPIGQIRSKELLSSTEVYFEPSDWKKYAKYFDTIYKIVFDYRNYGDRPQDLPHSDYVTFFAYNNETLKKYYRNIWACFTGHATDEGYISPLVWQEKYPQVAQWTLKTFNINNPTDLNQRFIQFKNYMYWKTLEEQQEILDTGQCGSLEEIEARAELKQEFDSDPALKALLGVDYANNTWYMRYSPSQYVGTSIITEDTQVPSFYWMKRTCDETEAKLIEKGVGGDELINVISETAFARMKKTSQIFKTVCSATESELFNSLERPTRSSKYSGTSYAQMDDWYPNMQNPLVKELMPVDVPVGQNMQYFYYDTHATVKYWMFAVIWAAISMGLFTAGAIVYYKYDVK